MARTYSCDVGDIGSSPSISDLGVYAGSSSEEAEGGVFPDCWSYLYEALLEDMGSAWRWYAAATDVSMEGGTVCGAMMYASGMSCDGGNVIFEG